MDFELDFGPDYAGRTFTHDIHVARDPAKGPGWFVWGRTANGVVVKTVARPAVKARKHPHYSIKVRRGWLLKRDAEFIASTVANLARCEETAHA